MKPNLEINISFYLNNSVLKWNIIHLEHYFTKQFSISSFIIITRYQIKSCEFVDLTRLGELCITGQKIKYYKVNI